MWKNEDLISPKLIEYGKNTKLIPSKAMIVLDFMKLYIEDNYKVDCYVNYGEHKNQGWCCEGHATNSHHYTGNAFDLNFTGDSVEIWNDIKLYIINNTNKLLLMDYDKRLYISNFELKEALNATFWERDITWGHFQIVPTKSGNRFFKA